MAANTELSPWIYARRFVLGLTIALFSLGFIIWRVDNPRIENWRFQIIDAMPEVDIISKPMANVTQFFGNFKSYNSLSDENRELRRQLRAMEQWREAALQLDQINAELRALNNLSVASAPDFITGDIIADSGSPFSQSAIISVGKNKNVEVGAAALDGFGLIGRITGVGDDRSRILLLNDPTSKISALIMPDRLRAIVTGNNSLDLELTVVDSTVNPLAAGSRVVTSGVGVLPPDLLLGYVTINDEANKVATVRIAADYKALEFARILRPSKAEPIDPYQGVVIPNADEAGDIDESELQ